MVTAIVVMTLIGVLLGGLLAAAVQLLHVEGNPMVEDIAAMLPGTNCGQCGFPGCQAAAEALVNQQSSPRCCPPGGSVLAQRIADKLGLELADEQGADEDDSRPLIARIDPWLCIGCGRCIKVCPTDAILGAVKQLHGVFPEACIGCRKCVDACNEHCIDMVPEALSLDNWVWPKPRVYS